LAVEILTVAIVVSAGVMFGVLLFMQMAILPMLNALPSSGFITACQKIYMEQFHPIMVWNAIAGIAMGMALIPLVDDWSARVLLLLGGAGITVVGVISEYFNRPRWRKFEKWNPEQAPPEWETLRTKWGWFHLVRTWAAGGVVVAFAVAGIIAL